MAEPDGADEPSLFCPRCGQPLRRLVQHRDFFCHDCHAVVEVLDGAFAVLLADMRDEQTLVTLETLRHPEASEELANEAGRSPGGA